MAGGKDMLNSMLQWLANRYKQLSDNKVNKSGDSMSGGLTFPNATTGMYGLNPDGERVQAFIPQHSSGATSMGYGNFIKGSGNGVVYGHDISFTISNVADGAANYAPYFNRGRTLELKRYIVGSAYNSTLRFQIPLAIPVIGSPTVTIASVDGVRVWGDGKWMYGSDPSTWVKPSSYSVGVSATAGLFVTATMPDATNVINGAVAIYASINIDFS